MLEVQNCLRAWAPYFATSSSANDKYPSFSQQSARRSKHAVSSFCTSTWFSCTRHSRYQKFINRQSASAARRWQLSWSQLHVSLQVFAEVGHRPRELSLGPVEFGQGEVGQPVELLVLGGGQEVPLRLLELPRESERFPPEVVEVAVVYLLVAGHPHHRPVVVFRKLVSQHLHEHPGPVLIHLGRRCLFRSLPDCWSHSLHYVLAPCLSISEYLNRNSNWLRGTAAFLGLDSFAGLEHLFELLADLELGLDGPIQSQQLPFDRGEARQREWQWCCLVRVV